MSGRAFFSVCTRSLRGAKCPDEGQPTEGGPEIADNRHITRTCARRHHSSNETTGHDDKSDKSLIGGLARPRRCRTHRKRPFQKLQHGAAGGAVVFVWVVDHEEFACRESGLDPHGCDTTACQIIDVCHATVAEYMGRRRQPPSQTWRTFLRNHIGQIVAADFFVVPTATYSLLFVLALLAHDRRRSRHIAVTAHPTAAWTAQQLREAFPWDEAPRSMLRDRDHAFRLPGEHRGRDGH
jgi:hypothetical protein